VLIELKLGRVARPDGTSRSLPRGRGVRGGGGYDPQGMHPQAGAGGYAGDWGCWGGGGGGGRGALRRLRDRPDR
jgi:hypothetical protein